MLSDGWMDGLLCVHILANAAITQNIQSKQLKGNSKRRRGTFFLDRLRGPPYLNLLVILSS